MLPSSLTSLHWIHAVSWCLISLYWLTCFCLTPQCAVLNKKLDSLLQALNMEAQAVLHPPHTTPPIVEEELEEEDEEEDELSEEMSEESLSELKEKLEETQTEKCFRPREQLMLRANSLKRAVRQIIEQAEKGRPGTQIPASA